MYPKYHPDLIPRFFKACQSADMDSCDEIAGLVLDMPHSEVVLFVSQVIMCPDNTDTGLVYSGMLTGALMTAAKNRKSKASETSKKA